MTCPGPARRLAAAALVALLFGCGDDPPLDVAVDGAYLIQGSQDYAGTVPLVQGRAGLFRVFLRARVAGLPSPTVRVRLREASGALARTYDATLQPPPSTVPVTVDEDSLAGSWNFAVPGEDVQPGRHLVAELEPAAGAPASLTQASHRYPAAGALDVRAVPALALTLVPVVQAPPGEAPLVPLVSGDEPGGGARTVDGWLDRARRLHPLLEVEVALGATYTTATALGPDGAGWADVLAELEQKRLVEGSGRSYLGAVHVAYAEGSAGIAYASTPLQPSSALAWDAGTTPDHPSYQRAAAHELGHLLGLLHAPCGTPMPAGLDPGWPTGAAYAGAHIGVVGWDPLAGALKVPASTYDHMSYCGTIDTTWASDFEYRRVIALLTDAPAGAATAAAPARQACVVVAGRLREGRVELEPAYVVDTVPSLPPPGEYDLDVLDGAGSPLASASFAPSAVPAERVGGPEERHFAFALPLPAGRAEAIRGLAVRQRGALLHRIALAADGEEETAPAVHALDRGHARVRWDARAAPGAMVRDPRTGEVLAFLRGGAGVVRTDAPALEVLLSDGVRTRRRVVVAP